VGFGAVILAGNQSTGVTVTKQLTTTNVSTVQPQDILESLKPQLAHLKLKDKFMWIPTNTEVEQVNELVFS